MPLESDPFGGISNVRIDGEVGFVNSDEHPETAPPRDRSRSVLVTVTSPDRQHLAMSGRPLSADGSLGASSRVTPGTDGFLNNHTELSMHGPISSDRNVQTRSAPGSSASSPSRASRKRSPARSAALAGRLRLSDLTYLQADTEAPSSSNAACISADVVADVVGGSDATRLQATSSDPLVSVMQPIGPSAVAIMDSFNAAGTGSAEAVGSEVATENGKSNAEKKTTGRGHAKKLPLLMNPGEEAHCDPLTPTLRMVRQHTCLLLR